MRGGAAPAFAAGEARRNPAGASMHWVRITNPKYDQSRRFAGRVGEVVGHWGPENSADGREGYLVECEDGEIIGVAQDEVEAVSDPEDGGDGWVGRTSGGGS